MEEQHPERGNSTRQTQTVTKHTHNKNGQRARQTVRASTCKVGTVSRHTTWSKTKHVPVQYSPVRYPLVPTSLPHYSTKKLVSPVTGVDHVLMFKVECWLPACAFFRRADSFSSISPRLRGLSSSILECKNASTVNSFRPMDRGPASGSLSSTQCSSSQPGERAHFSASDKKIKQEQKQEKSTSKENSKTEQT